MNQETITASRAATRRGRGGGGPTRDVVVLAPVLNEEAAVERFLENWTQFEWDILLVDGISRDRTIAIIEQFRVEGPDGERVRLHRAPERAGLAVNMCLGFEAALAKGYSYVIVVDVGTQEPADAWRMLQSIRQNPADQRVIPRGSYFLKGSTVLNFPVYRRAVTMVAAWASRLLLGPTGTYPTHAFKVWPRQALQEIPYRGLVDGTVAHCRNGPEFQVGLTLLSLRHGWSIKEYPMTFFGTKSTFRWGWIPNFMRQVARLRQYQPDGRQFC